MIWLAIGLVTMVALALLQKLRFRRAVWRLLRTEWRALGDIEEDLGLWPSRMGSLPRPTSNVELLLAEWCREGRVISSWGSTGRSRRLSMVYLGEPIYALAPQKSEGA